MKLLTRILLLTVLGALLFLLSNDGARTDWCNTRRCSIRNIACHTSGNYSLMCYPKAKVIPISRYSKLILVLFNTFRNKVAGGKVDYLVKAARMARMVWSSDLEYLSRLVVMTCSFNPTICMSSKRFAYISHINEYYSYLGRETDQTNYQIIKQIIENWFQEVKNIDSDIAGYLPTELRNENTQKVTLAVNEMNTHIGCAGLRYTYQHRHSFLFTCAFATSNFVHKPLYRFSMYAGSRCKKRDKQYPNLCDSSEKYKTDVYYEGAKIYEHPID